MAWGVSVRGGLAALEGGWLRACAAVLWGSSVVLPRGGRLALWLRGPPAKLGTLPCWWGWLPGRLVLPMRTPGNGPWNGRGHVTAWVALQRFSRTAPSTVAPRGGFREPPGACSEGAGQPGRPYDRLGCRAAQEEGGVLVAGWPSGPWTPKGNPSEKRGLGGQWVARVLGPLGQCQCYCQTGPQVSSVVVLVGPAVRLPDWA